MKLFIILAVHLLLLNTSCEEDNSQNNSSLNNVNLECPGTFLALDDQDCMTIPNCVGYPVVLGLYDSNGIIRASERIFSDAFGIGASINICKREVLLNPINNQNNQNNTIGRPYFCKKFNSNGLYLSTVYVDEKDMAEGWVPCETLTRAPVCGNGVIEPGEQCDTGQLGTFESCALHSAAYGGPQYTDGNVACYDRSGTCIWNLGDCQ